MAVTSMAGGMPVKSQIFVAPQNNELRLRKYPETSLNGRLTNLLLDSGFIARDADLFYQVLEHKADLVLNYLSPSSNSNLRIILRAYEKLRSHPELQEELFNLILNNLKVISDIKHPTKEILEFYSFLTEKTDNILIKDQIKQAISKNRLLGTKDQTTIPIIRLEAGFSLLKDWHMAFSAIEESFFNLLANDMELLISTQDFYQKPSQVFQKLVQEYNFLLRENTLNTLTSARQKIALSLLEKAKTLFSLDPYVHQRLFYEINSLFVVQKSELSRFLKDLVNLILDEAQTAFDERILRLLSLLVKVEPRLWFTLPYNLRELLMREQYNLINPYPYPYNYMHDNAGPTTIMPNATQLPGTMKMAESELQPRMPANMTEEEYLNLLMQDPEVQKYLKQLPAKEAKETPKEIKETKEIKEQAEKKEIKKPVIKDKQILKTEKVIEPVKPKPMEQIKDLPHIKLQ